MYRLLPEEQELHICADMASKKLLVYCTIKSVWAKLQKIGFTPDGSPHGMALPSKHELAIVTYKNGRPKITHLFGKEMAKEDNNE